MEIANPIYDVVFKYMMEDNDVAKLLVSSIIGEEVISLEPKPQEYTTEIYKSEGSNTSIITVFRLDFLAKIETLDGHKLIIIELQKASTHTDIPRFRRYLGKQYANESHSVKDESGVNVPLQIYSIYFLGDDLKIRDTPVLSVFPEIRDVATQEVIEERSRFIELLNHKCWIVQISCLKKRRRNELEQLLTVFDQTNRGDDSHVMRVNEDEIPEKYRPLIRRLKMAASNETVKKQMQDEDEIWTYIRNEARIKLHEGREEMRKEMRKEMEGVIAQKDEAIAQKDEENEALRRENEQLRMKIKNE